MAKDDYQVVLYRLLVYLYACKKRKIIFDERAFQETVKKNVDNEQYFYDVLKMAQEEGFIKGAKFQRAWGQDKIPLFDNDDLEITSAGIIYLEENSTMKKIGETLKEATDTISNLAAIALIG